MTQEIIQRSLQLDALEFEGTEGRTLHARLLRWNAVSQVQDHGLKPSYGEEWLRGVFSQSIRRAERTKRGWPLMYNHHIQSLPIGMVSSVHERDDGPWMTSKISRTSLGDDIIELIRDGAIPGVSLNGRNIKSRRTKEGVVQRMEVALDEISLTPFPQLVGADELVLRASNTMNPSFPAININYSPSPPLEQAYEHEEPENDDRYIVGSRKALTDFLAQLDDPLPGR